MRKVSMAARDELVNALARRYAVAGRAEKTRILDDFVAITGGDASELGNGGVYETIETRNSEMANETLDLNDLQESLGSPSS